MKVFIISHFVVDFVMLFQRFHVEISMKFPHIFQIIDLKFIDASIESIKRTNFGLNQYAKWAVNVLTFCKALFFSSNLALTCVSASCV